MNARDILQAALALPIEERVHLLEELEASLPDAAEDAFIDMVNAHLAASEAGAPAYPADEVFARLRAK